MIAPTQLRLIVVTPETTLLDEPIRSVRFPLYDGQMGVLPGAYPPWDDSAWGNCVTTATREARATSLMVDSCRSKGEW